MKQNKSSQFHSASYKEIGNFRDRHDFSKFWDKTKEESFEFEIEPEVTYFAVEKTPLKKDSNSSSKKDITPDTLVNLWVQEKLREETIE